MLRKAFQVVAVEVGMLPTSSSDLTQIQPGCCRKGGGGGGGVKDLATGQVHQTRFSLMSLARQGVTIGEEREATSAEPGLNLTSEEKAEKAR